MWSFELVQGEVQNEAMLCNCTQQQIRLYRNLQEGLLSIMIQTSVCEGLTACHKLHKAKQQIKSYKWNPELLPAVTAPGFRTSAFLPPLSVPSETHPQRQLGQPAIFAKPLSCINSAHRQKAKADSFVHVCASACVWVSVTKMCHEPFNKYRWNFLKIFCWIPLHLVHIWSLPNSRWLSQPNESR